MLAKMGKSEVKAGHQYLDVREKYSFFYSFSSLHLCNINVFVMFNFSIFIKVCCSTSWWEPESERTKYLFSLLYLVISFSQ